MSRDRRSPRIATSRTYPWIVVGLLWFCGFFNYADRLALSAVFPLLGEEFGIGNTEKGTLGSAFMLLYAIASPLTGYLVDRYSRRWLVVAGLAVWSLVCAATGMARGFRQLVFLRAAEGLGEASYFPASMSILADYHGPSTRSRAMSVHQTSVYLGTAGGWLLGGYLGEVAGWRAPFWGLGLAGLAYAMILGLVLVEPKRGSPSEPETTPERPRSSSSLASKVAIIASNPAAALLLLVFVGANFVAAALLVWLPSMVGEALGLGLSGSAFTSMLWALASVPGAAIGGWLADRAACRSAGGRIRTQALGLLIAAPFVLLSGGTGSVALLMIALVGAGLCKGIYDANIFAALYDVVPVEDRGTAAGLMNTVGWTGGVVAPIAVGLASDRFGLSVAIASTAVVYLAVGSLAIAAARTADRKATTAA